MLGDSMDAMVKKPWLMGFVDLRGQCAQLSSELQKFEVRVYRDKKLSSDAKSIS
jgi:hypothetical protein